MKKNIIIFFMLVFDIYAFIHGKVYHVSAAYEDFYIKHAISAEQYAARIRAEEKNAQHSYSQDDPKETIYHSKPLYPE